jgi:hypothetical protein
MKNLLCYLEFFKIKQISFIDLFYFFLVHQNHFLSSVTNDFDTSSKLHKTNTIMPHIQQQNQYSAIVNNNYSNSNIKQINSSSNNTTVNSVATPSSTMSIPSIALSKNNLNHMNGINESMECYVKPSTSLHVIHSEEDFIENKVSNNPIQLNQSSLAVKTPVSGQING